MAISFNEIPNQILTPFVAVEFDNSQAIQGPSIQEYKALLIGQKVASGSATALEVVPVTSSDQAKSLFGQGSILAHMVEKFIDNNSSSQLFCLPMDDNGAGVAATGKLAFTGPATAAGTLSIMIGGRRVQVAVDSGDSADDVASALNTAISGEADLPVTSAVNGTNANEVDLTAKNDGEASNEIDLRANYFSGEEFPAGIALTITAMASGTGNPDISTALAVLDEDTQYNIIGHAYTDAANLTALEAELLDRFGPMKPIDGVAFTAKRGDFSTLTTLGNSRNSQNSSIVYCTEPNSPWEKAGAVCGRITLNGQIDPARPFQTLGLDGLFVTKETERFTREERDNLLKNGIATTKDNVAIVQIERMVTTYQTNAFGAVDPSYRDVNTLLTLSFLRFDFRSTIARKYPRHKLADDGTRIAPGQAIVTPSTMRAESVSIFRGWEDLGLVENIDQFKRDLVVERNVQDRNRLDLLLPPDLINQLRVTAAQIQFRL